MAKLFNRAKMTTSTTGSGTVTLGSASVGYQSFADAGVSNGDVVQYVIEEGGNFEIGTGTYSATGTSLTRSPTESSNSNAAISLSGAATVSITAVADDLNRLQHEGSTKVEPSATGATVTGNLAVTGTVDGRDVAADGTKLDGIESGATADQTASEIRSLVESATDSNVFTDADHTKLNGIESGATADQTASEILTAIKTVDGAGSGLDADTLDGSHASAFLTGNQTITLTGDATGSGTTSINVTVANDSHTHDGRYYTETEADSRFVNVTGDTMSGQLVVDDGNANPLELRRSSQVGIEFNDTSVGSRYLGVNGGNLWFGSNLNHGVNQKVFTDAYHPNADKWTTARTLSLSGDASGSVSWDGSANATLSVSVGDADTVDGIQASSFVRSDASDTLTGATYTLSSTTDQKIILQGSSNPYIRFREGTTDRAYIQWNSTNNALRFHNQESDFFDFRPHDTGGAVNIRLRGSDDDTWGSVYASENGGNHSIGLLDGDGNWAYRHNKDVDHAWIINTVTEMSLNTSELNLSGNNINNVSNMYVGSTIYHYGDTDTYINFGTDLMYIYTGNVPRVTVNNSGVRLGDNGNGYFRPVSGNYGSIEIDGGAHSSWEGYSIGGRAVFMHDNASRMGLFDDTYNHWGFFYDFNGDANLTYAGSVKLQTYSGGVTITGDLNSTSDIRYKKNIQTIDSALEKVQSLRGVTFDWDNDAFLENENTEKPNLTERATGVIAQDVEKVLPEAVRENKDGFKNVAYGNMVGLLIEAIKEQQEQINALKAQLNS